MSAAERRAALAGCPLFQGLEEEALDHLAAASMLQRARKGEAIIHEGEHGERLFVIVAGRVRTEKRTPSGDLWTVRLIEQGGVFGELSLLDREIRSATVSAEADCTLLGIDRDRFQAFGDRHPRAGLAVTRRLAERLASRLRKSNEDAVTLFSALVHEIERKL